MKTCIENAYCYEYDITFIMECTFDENNDCHSIEVKGFYYGTPTDEANKQYYGYLKCTFDK